ncbi:hypothetical protein D3C72_2379680 [compost metagenome]
MHAAAPREHGVQQVVPFGGAAFGQGSKHIQRQPQLFQQTGLVGQQAQTLQPQHHLARGQAQPAGHGGRGRHALA